MKPWIRRGNYVFEDDAMTHRTVEGAMRAIESALENSDRWLVERSDDMLAMRPIYRRATSLSEFYFEWGWMNQYQGWIVPFGVTSASLRFSAARQGIRVTYELDCRGMFALTATVSALVTVLVMALSDFAGIFVFVALPLAFVLDFLAIPAQFGSLLRRMIDQPAGPRRSLLDLLTR